MILIRQRKYRPQCTRTQQRQHWHQLRWRASYPQLSSSKCQRKFNTNYGLKDSRKQKKMAELLSVQVHVPLTKGDDGKLLEKGATRPALGRIQRLKKVENSSLDTTGNKFNAVSKRKAVDVEFKGLTYSVSEGRKKGEVTTTYSLLLNSSLNFMLLLI